MITLIERLPLSDARRILTDSEVWPFVCEQGQIKEEFEPVDHPSVNYLGVYQLKKLVGVFVTHAEGLSCVKAHIAILKPYRGSLAINSVRKLIEWFADLPERINKLNADIPTYNETAIRIARFCGFVEEGFCRESIMKDNEFYGQVRFGLTKEEAKQLCQVQYQ